MPIEFHFGLVINLCIVKNIWAHLSEPVGYLSVRIIALVLPNPSSNILDKDNWQLDRMDVDTSAFAAPLIPLP